MVRVSPINLVGVGLVSSLLWGSGCYLGVDSLDGLKDDDLPGRVPPGQDGGDDGVESACGAAPEPGASPIRRLTGWEYENTVFDLLGDDSHPAAGFPQEGGSGFDNNADVSAVTRLMAQKYMLAAEDIASRAVGDLQTLLPCDPAAGERACVEQWVEGFGLRAWRRPLSTTERDALLALFDEARAVDDLPTSVGAVLQAFLQSPHFLYRVELGVPGEQGEAAVALDDYEMASRLSYFLWGSMPDAELLDAAAAGELRDPAVIEEHARRMLEDPKARRMVEHFHEQWLSTIKLASIDKDPGLFPDWSPEIALRQADEVAAFVEHVFFDADEPTLRTLLTAPHTYVDADLAEFYGLPAPQGTGLQQVESPAGGPVLSGILTQGGILSAYSKANQTNPIARGIFVREHLLCQIPPPPPDDVELIPPEPDPNATTREIFEQHRDDPACNGCHSMFDPIGFGFENFDAVGRWRTTENDLPIDASGELSAADVAGPFDGAAELDEPARRGRVGVGEGMALADFERGEGGDAAFAVL